MKKDEKQLLKECQRWEGACMPAMDIAFLLEIDDKRAAYILNKWIKKNWYECGVSIRHGWLTKEGINAKQTQDP